MQLLQYQKGDIDFPDSTLKDSHVSGCAIDFIRSLMRIEPSQRLTAKKALDHSWFAVSNVSQTHTHIASTIRMTDEFMPATSLHQIQAPTIHDVNDEAVVSEKREFPTSTQTTEASAKWTETIPIRSEDNQASGMWTETVADPAARKGHSALHHRLSVLQRTPETVIAKRKETSDDSRVPGTILPWYPNKYLGQDPDVERGAEQRETADRKRHLKETARMLQAADLSNRARAFRRENKSPDLDDLKKFSQNFKLSTPVPSSLLPRGSNDEKRPLLDEAYPKRYTPVHKSNVEEDYESTQRANLVKAEMQRQPYSNAPPSSSLHSSLLPPPAGLRPRSLSASKSTQSKSRPQSQTLPYTVSQTHVPEGKAPMPNQWEEAPRIQEDIAQSTLQKPEADSKPRVLLKGQCCKLCVR
ncbi:uncharacterized protein J4E92_000493 [Alternaria infectoria]|uniref:uncharacterized protein n=1 Tax=Alternaria infectoria TaxID=45303 RepID=UPI00221EA8EC|nr:uncharacterized protein J4E92_000493 [Alternaria infectoria]KAI4939209.1 hypothetical protein J4E92_000493 [Alternaria infectoria]